MKKLIIVPTKEEQLRERVVLAKKKKEMIHYLHYNLWFTPFEIEEHWEEERWRHWDISNWQFVKATKYLSLQITILEKTVKEISLKISKLTKIAKMYDLF